MLCTNVTNALSEVTGIALLLAVFTFLFPTFILPLVNTMRPNNTKPQTNGDYELLQLEEDEMVSENIDEEKGITKSVICWTTIQIILTVSVAVLSICVIVLSNAKPI